MSSKINVSCCCLRLLVFMNLSIFECCLVYRTEDTLKSLDKMVTSILQESSELDWEFLDS